MQNNSPLFINHLGYIIAIDDDSASGRRNMFAHGYNDDYSAHLAGEMGEGLRWMLVVFYW